MKHVFLGGLVGILVLSGCGKDGSSTSAAMNEPLNGKIAGRAWKIQFGTARQDKLTGGWRFSLFDFAPGQDPCTATYNLGDTIYLVSFGTKENTVGDYDTKSKPVSLTKAVSGGAGFSSSTQGAFGESRITYSDSEKIEGQLNVKGNDDNYVKGKFTAKVCK